MTCPNCAANKSDDFEWLAIWRKYHVWGCKVCGHIFQVINR